MKAILMCLSFLLSQLTLASMIPVTKNSPDLVKNYSSGICSIGSNTEGTNCCTGFRIDKNLVMTNFHCLACVHKLFKALQQSTPPMMEPTRFLYSLPGDSAFTNIVKDRLRYELGMDIDYDKFFIPHSDAEFRELMGRYPELLTRINFNNTIDNEIPLNASAYRIVEIMAMNLSLDYAVLRVEGLQDEEKILKLNAQTLLPRQQLAIMGHPSVGPYPNKKVYDISSDCKVINPRYDELGDVRINVFTHHCSTAPGSSGSPIVDRLNGKVIGIHWGASDVKDVRFGIEMKSILRDLAEDWQVRVKNRR